MTDIEVTETPQIETPSDAVPDGMLANPTRVRI